VLFRSVNQAPFFVTTAPFENNIIGQSTVSTIAATITGTSILTVGIYIINYEIKFSAPGRVFTYQSVGVASTAGSLSNNPVLGGQQSSDIPYTAPVPAGLFQERRFTGCFVANITVATALFLVVLNNFTGAAYTTFGSIRYTKLS
jgi:hypothetical protein